jgi:hypothetical protein
VSSNRELSQRDAIREARRLHGGDDDAVANHYTRLELAGVVRRRRNSWNLTALRYAGYLNKDERRRGW